MSRQAERVSGFFCLFFGQFMAVVILLIFDGIKE